ncbi:very short patch repair endonuclease [Halomonas denitrificans]|nr:very short patch repair endonuclease [Halomonas denitrificans]
MTEFSRLRKEAGFSIPDAVEAFSYCERTIYCWETRKSSQRKEELMVRKALHTQGFRYCPHVLKVLRKHDLAFPKWSVEIFVNGCFWHGHDFHLHKVPSTQTAFWREKIGFDQVVDSAVRWLKSSSLSLEIRGAA